MTIDEGRLGIEIGVVVSGISQWVIGASVWAVIGVGAIIFTESLILV